MKAILQRVHSASVTVEQQLVSQIGKGILVLAAVGKNDTHKEAETLASKIARMKLWDDESGEKWKKNISDVDGEVLCVSQFTLYANTKKGSKPDFHHSAGPEKGRELYEFFFSKVQEQLQAGKVKNGVFQAMMDVALVNDGPVTLEINVEAPAGNPNAAQSPTIKTAVAEPASHDQKTAEP